MKTITTNNRTLLFVEVPKDATDMECRTAVLAQCFDRDYNFIATTDTITEQQAAMFVDNMDRDWLYRDYTTPYIHHVYTTALYSFKSLLQHHSITGRHAIIEVLH